MIKRAHLGAVLIFVMGCAFMGKGLWIGGKAVVAQILLEKAWDQSVKTSEPTVPWAWMDAYPMAKITIPSLGRSTIVLSTASGQALAFGPAHMQQTPKPGQSGTAIIAAHKNTHFDFLKDVRTGDIIEVQMADNTRLRFEVSKAEIVHKDRSGIPAHETLDAPKRLALVTCYPFDAISFGGPMRYIITADLINT